MYSCALALVTLFVLMYVVSNVLEVNKGFHCKNTWVTLTTFLGCISATKECYQVGFFDLIDWKRFSLVPFASLFFQETYLVTFLVFPPQVCNQGTLQGQMCKIKKKTRQKCWFISILKGYTNLTKEGSFSTTHCSSCKHFVNFKCHTHKRNATELTKIWLK